MRCLPVANKIEIPDKLYFKIGEVAKLVGVAPYVLRYWETEFKEIGPVKSRTNQRLYRKKDLERIIRVKSLLYEEGYTIEGARRRLEEEEHPEGGTGSDSNSLLATLRKELEGLLVLVST